jgi:hypothetical protein
VFVSISETSVRSEVSLRVLANDVGVGVGCFDIVS